jgi:transcriptional regulator of arginine metabolism
MKHKHNKKERRDIITELLTNEVISSQQGLRNRLHQIGVEVNQATLSRDLRDMGVLKVPLGGGGARYVPGSTQGRADDQREELFSRTIQRLAFSGNLMLVFTAPGMAQAAAIALDGLALPAILGTVAGDDTVIAVLDEGVDRKAFEKDFRAMLARGR